MFKLNRQGTVVTSALLLLPACSLLIDTTPDGVKRDSGAAGQSSVSASSSTSAGAPLSPLEREKGGNVGTSLGLFGGSSSQNHTGATDRGGTASGTTTSRNNNGGSVALTLGGTTSTTSDALSGGAQAVTSSTSAGGIATKTGETMGSGVIGGSATRGVSAGTGGIPASGGRTNANEKPLVISLALGSYHSCALFNTGTVKCWGCNDFGRLGDGTEMHAATAVEVVGINNARAISAGRWTTCALLADGTVACWGDNSAGQLGSGTTEPKSLVPIAVPGLANVTRLTSGVAHECVLMGAGATKCWGANSFGQLGNGLLDDSSAPVTPAGGYYFDRMSASYHTCMTTSMGSVACWGLNANGELGDGTSGEGANKSAPVLVEGLDLVSGIAVGASHTCALRSDRTVHCWGVAVSNGLPIQINAPTQVKDLTSVTTIAAQLSHTCAIVSEATGSSVKCWGGNSWGELGDGTTTDSAQPVQAKGIDSATNIAVGFHHSCALRTDG